MTCWLHAIFVVCQFRNSNPIVFVAYFLYCNRHQLLGKIPTVFIIIFSFVFFSNWKLKFTSFGMVLCAIKNRLMFRWQNESHTNERHATFQEIHLIGINLTEPVESMCSQWKCAHNTNCYKWWIPSLFSDAGMYMCMGLCIWMWKCQCKKDRRKKHQKTFTTHTHIHTIHILVLLILILIHRRTHIERIHSCIISLLYSIVFVACICVCVRALLNEKTDYCPY